MFFWLLIAVFASLSAWFAVFSFRRKCCIFTPLPRSVNPDRNLPVHASKNNPVETDLEKKLLHRTRELAALNAVALALGEASTLTAVLDKSLVKIFGTLDGLEHKGAVFLCEPDGDTLRLAAQQGLSQGFLHRSEILRADECLCGKVIETGEIMYTKQGCKILSDAEDALATPTHVIIPIKSRGVVLGVIFLFPTQDFVLSPFDLQMFEIIGAQLALAVENFRFYVEVKDASEKYWDLFENARDILFIVDSEGRLAAVNKAAEEFSGYSRTELIGKNVREFLTRESAQAAVRLLASGLPKFLEVEVLKRDESHAFLEVSTRKMSSNLFPAGFQISARDITEQKNLRSMLLKTERLGAIGQIGVAMRHEINNPLTTVIGNLELLLERYGGKDPETEARLQVILNNALRIAEIIRRVEEIKQDKVVEYLKGIKMTDLKE